LSGNIWVVQPNDRAPAPPPLDLVQDFVNTRDVGHDQDEFTDPARLARWLHDRGLLDERIRLDQRHLDQAIVVREGLRALLLENNGAALAEDRAAIQALDEAASALPVRIRHTTATLLEPAEPDAPSSGLAAILAVTVSARVDGSWSRLKACRERDCRWVFYDASKNRSGTWCSMAVCGTEAKKRAFIERRRRRREQQSGTA
jgi:predicted RNA-binding Zn ribbon-like protein